jgi:hypothetical protein
MAEIIKPGDGPTAENHLKTAHGRLAALAKRLE